MEEKTDRLFTGFPPVSTREWDAKIREDLKGADYEKKLIWKTPEGFKVKPFYSAEDLQDLPYPEMEPGQFPFVRGGGPSQPAMPGRSGRISSYTTYLLPFRRLRWPLKTG